MDWFWIKWKASCEYKNRKNKYLYLNYIIVTTIANNNDSQKELRLIHVTTFDQNKFGTRKFGRKRFISKIHVTFITRLCFKNLNFQKSKTDKLLLPSFACK